MMIIGIYEKYNNQYKRRSKHTSKCGKRPYLYFYDDNGNFKTKAVTRFEALQYKLLLKKPKPRKQVVCDICGIMQEWKNQEVCVNCGQ